MLGVKMGISAFPGNSSLTQGRMSMMGRGITPGSAVPEQAGAGAGAQLSPVPPAKLCSRVWELPVTLGGTNWAGAAWREQSQPGKLEGLRW